MDSSFCDVLGAFALDDLAGSIIGVRGRAKKNDGVVGLGAVQELIERLCATTNAEDENAGCIGIKGAPMPDLDVDPLFDFAALALLMGRFAGTACTLGCEPGSEVLRGIEMVLEVADDLGGGLPGRLVDCLSKCLRLALGRQIDGVYQGRAEL